ncbi:MAG: hypothetical protein ACI837_000946 [Crocinitomicaceae bacterium]|jgi:hypothetical protein
MPCNSERTRQQDKYTAWENAHADVLAAGVAVLAAEASVAVACPFFWTGLGTALCAAGVAALATAGGVMTGAVMKRSAAEAAYHQAFSEWQACLARCNRS